MSPGGTAPQLTIVVGARAGEGSAEQCLRALAAQIDDRTELILVEDSPSAPRDVACSKRLVRPGGLVPELWAEGIRQSSGDLVGLLAATVVPDPDWVGLTLELHKGDEAGIGGGIEPGAAMRLVDWAIYFCRYAPYMAPVSPDRSLDVAGDNASYRREVLSRYAHLYREAFAEPFVHRAMRADGHELRVDPSRVVRHTGGADARTFCRQRFLHGQSHGQLRSAGLSRIKVALGAATAPLVPAVMTLRVARQVLGKRRHVGAFAASAPLVVWFYCWWAAGELVGRLRSATATAATRPG